MLRLAGDYLCEVLVTGRTGRSYKKWYLAPDYGFLPIEMTRHSDAGYVETRTIVTKVRKCENGAFVAERSVSIKHPNAPIPKRAWILELGELDLTRPSETALRIELAAGSAIVEPPKMLANVRLPGSEEVGVEDLASWVQWCREARQIKLAVRRPRSEPAGIGTRRWGLVLLGILLLAGVGTLLAWHNRRRGADAPRSHVQARWSRRS